MHNRVEIYSYLHRSRRAQVRHDLWFIKHVPTHEFASNRPTVIGMGRTFDFFLMNPWAHEKICFRLGAMLVLLMWVYREP